MKKFVVKEVKEIIREAEITAETAIQALIKFKNSGTDFTKLSEESHITVETESEFSEQSIIAN